MGAAVSVDEEGATAYAEEVVTGMGLDGTSDEDVAKITADCTLVHNCISSGVNAELSANYKGGAFPGGSDKAKGEAKSLSIWKWKVSSYLKGAALFAMHMDKVHALYEAMGPVNVPKKGIQVTRKALMEKMTATGMAANVAAANVNVVMYKIGKEKAQSSLSEAQYMAAITAIMTSENGDMSNWDAEKWAILDASKSPLTAAVKADLDKLDTKGEFGINQHEMRIYFFELFMNHGEVALKELEGWTKLVGGEMAADEFAVEAA